MVKKLARDKRVAPGTKGASNKGHERLSSKTGKGAGAETKAVLIQGLSSRELTKKLMNEIEASERSTTAQSVSVDNPVENERPDEMNVYVRDLGNRHGDPGNHPANATHKDVTRTSYRTRGVDIVIGNLQGQTGEFVSEAERPSEHRRSKDERFFEAEEQDDQVFEAEEQDEAHPEQTESTIRAFLLLAGKKAREERKTTGESTNIEGVDEVDDIINDFVRTMNSQHRSKGQSVPSHSALIALKTAALSLKADETVPSSGFPTCRPSKGATSASNEVVPVEILASKSGKEKENETKENGEPSPENVLPSFLFFDEDEKVEVQDDHAAPSTVTNSIMDWAANEPKEEIVPVPVRLSVRPTVKNGKKKMDGGSPNWSTEYEWRQRSEIRNVITKGGPPHSTASKSTLAGAVPLAGQNRESRVRRRSSAGRSSEHSAASPGSRIFGRSNDLSLPTSNATIGSLERKKKKVLGSSTLATSKSVSPVQKNLSRTREKHQETERMEHKKYDQNRAASLALPRDSSGRRRSSMSVDSKVERLRNMHYGEQTTLDGRAPLSREGGFFLKRPRMQQLERRVSELDGFVKAREERQEASNLVPGMGTISGSRRGMNRSRSTTHAVGAPLMGAIGTNAMHCVANPMKDPPCSHAFNHVMEQLLVKRSKVKQASLDARDSGLPLKSKGTSEYHYLEPRDFKKFRDSDSEFAQAVYKTVMPFIAREEALEAEVGKKDGKNLFPKGSMNAGHTSNEGEDDSSSREGDEPNSSRIETKQHVKARHAILENRDDTTQFRLSKLLEKGGLSEVGIPTSNLDDRDTYEDATSRKLMERLVKLDLFSENTLSHLFDMVRDVGSRTVLSNAPTANTLVSPQSLSRRTKDLLRNVDSHRNWNEERVEQVTGQFSDGDDESSAITLENFGGRIYLGGGFVYDKRTLAQWMLRFYPTFLGFLRPPLSYDCEAGNAESHQIRLHKWEDYLVDEKEVGRKKIPPRSYPTKYRIQEVIEEIYAAWEKPRAMNAPLIESFPQFAYEIMTTELKMNPQDVWNFTLALVNFVVSIEILVKDESLWVLQAAGDSNLLPAEKNGVGEENERTAAENVETAENTGTASNLSVSMRANFGLTKSTASVIGTEDNVSKGGDSKAHSKGGDSQADSTGPSSKGRDLALRQGTALPFTRRMHPSGGALISSYGAEGTSSRGKELTPGLSKRFTALDPRTLLPKQCKSIASMGGLWENNLRRKAVSETIVNDTKSSPPRANDTTSKGVKLSVSATNFVMSGNASKLSTRYNGANKGQPVRFFDGESSVSDGSELDLGSASPSIGSVAWGTELSEADIDQFPGVICDPEALTSKNQKETLHTTKKKNNSASRTEILEDPAQTTLGKRLASSLAQKKNMVFTRRFNKVQTRDDSPLSLELGKSLPFFRPTFRGTTNARTTVNHSVRSMYDDMLISDLLEEGVMKAEKTCNLNSDQFLDRLLSTIVYTDLWVFSSFLDETLDAEDLSKHLKLKVALDAAFPRRGKGELESLGYPQSISENLGETLQEGDESGKSVKDIRGLIDSVRNDRHVMSYAAENKSAKRQHATLTHPFEHDVEEVLQLESRLTEKRLELLAEVVNLRDKDEILQDMEAYRRGEKTYFRDKTLVQMARENKAEAQKKVQQLSREIDRDKAELEYTREMLSMSKPCDVSGKPLVAVRNSEDGIVGRKFWLPHGNPARESNTPLQKQKMSAGGFKTSATKSDLKSSTNLRAVSAPPEHTESIEAAPTRKGTWNHSVKIVCPPAGSSPLPLPGNKKTHFGPKKKRSKEAHVSQDDDVFGMMGSSMSGCDTATLQRVGAQVNFYPERDDKRDEDAVAQGDQEDPDDRVNEVGEDVIHKHRPLNEDVVAETTDSSHKYWPQMGPGTKQNPYSSSPGRQARYRGRSLSNKRAASEKPKKLASFPSQITSFDPRPRFFHGKTPDSFLQSTVQCQKRGRFGNPNFCPTRKPSVSFSRSPTRTVNVRGRSLQQVRDGCRLENLPNDTCSNSANLPLRAMFFYPELDDDSVAASENAKPVAANDVVTDRASGIHAANNRIFGANVLRREVSEPTMSLRTMKSSSLLPTNRCIVTQRTPRDSPKNKESPPSKLQDVMGIRLHSAGRQAHTLRGVLHFPERRPHSSEAWVHSVEIGSQSSEARSHSPSFLYYEDNKKLVQEKTALKGKRGKGNKILSSKANEGGVDGNSGFVKMFSNAPLKSSGKTGSFKSSGLSSSSKLSRISMGSGVVGDRIFGMNRFSSMSPSSSMSKSSRSRLSSMRGGPSMVKNSGFDEPLKKMLSRGKADAEGGEDKSERKKIDLHRPDRYYDVLSLLRAYEITLEIFDDVQFFNFVTDSLEQMSSSLRAIKRRYDTNLFRVFKSSEDPTTASTWPNRVIPAELYRNFIMLQYNSWREKKLLLPVAFGLESPRDLKDKEDFEPVLGSKNSSQDGKSLIKYALKKHKFDSRQQQVGPLGYSVSGAEMNAAKGTVRPANAHCGTSAGGTVFDLVLDAWKTPGDANSLIHNAVIPKPKLLCVRVQPLRPVLNPRLAGKLSEEKNPDEEEFLQEAFQFFNQVDGIVEEESKLFSKVKLIGFLEEQETKFHATEESIMSRINDMDELELDKEISQKLMRLARNRPDSEFLAKYEPDELLDLVLDDRRSFSAFRNAQCLQPIGYHLPKIAKIISQLNLPMIENVEPPTSHSRMSAMTPAYLSGSAGSPLVMDAANANQQALRKAKQALHQQRNRQYLDHRVVGELNVDRFLSFMQQRKSAFLGQEEIGMKEDKEELNVDDDKNEADGMEVDELDDDQLADFFFNDKSPKVGDTLEKRGFGMSGAGSLLMSSLPLSGVQGNRASGEIIPPESLTLEKPPPRKSREFESMAMMVGNTAGSTQGILSGATPGGILKLSSIPEALRESPAESNPDNTMDLQDDDDVDTRGTAPMGASFRVTPDEDPRGTASMTTDVGGAFYGESSPIRYYGERKYGQKSTVLHYSEIPILQRDRVMVDPDLVASVPPLLFFSEAPQTRSIHGKEDVPESSDVPTKGRAENPGRDNNVLPNIADLQVEKINTRNRLLDVANQGNQLWNQDGTPMLGKNLSRLVSALQPEDPNAFQDSEERAESHNALNNYVKKWENVLIAPESMKTDNVQAKAQEAANLSRQFGEVDESMQDLLKNTAATDPVHVARVINYTDEAERGGQLGTETAKTQRAHLISQLKGKGAWVPVDVNGKGGGFVRSGKGGRGLGLDKLLKDKSAVEIGTKTQGLKGIVGSMPHFMIEGGMRLNLGGKGAQHQVNLMDRETQRQAVLGKGARNRFDWNLGYPTMYSHYVPGINHQLPVTSNYQPSFPAGNAMCPGGPIVRAIDNPNSITNQLNEAVDYEQHLALKEDKTLSATFLAKRAANRQLELRAEVHSLTQKDHAYTQKERAPGIEGVANEYEMQDLEEYEKRKANNLTKLTTKLLGAMNETNKCAMPGSGSIRDVNAQQLANEIMRKELDQKISETIRYAPSSDVIARLLQGDQAKNRQNPDEDLHAEVDGLEIRQTPLIHWFLGAKGGKMLKVDCSRAFASRNESLKRTFIGAVNRIRIMNRVMHHWQGVQQGKILTQARTSKKVDDSRSFAADAAKLLNAGRKSIQNESATRGGPEASDQEDTELQDPSRTETQNERRRDMHLHVQDIEDSGPSCESYKVAATASINTVTKGEIRKVTAEAMRAISVERMRSGTRRASIGPVSEASLKGPASNTASGMRGAAAAIDANRRRSTSFMGSSQTAAQRLEALKAGTLKGASAQERGSVTLEAMRRRVSKRSEANSSRIVQSSQSTQSTSSQRVQKRVSQTGERLLPTLEAVQRRVSEGTSSQRMQNRAPSTVEPVSPSVKMKPRGFIDDAEVVTPTPERMSETPAGTVDDRGLDTDPTADDTAEMTNDNAVESNSMNDDAGGEKYFSLSGRVSHRTAPFDPRVVANAARRSMPTPTGFSAVAAAMFEKPRTMSMVFKETATSSKKLSSIGENSRVGAEQLSVGEPKILDQNLRQPFGIQKAADSAGELDEVTVASMDMVLLNDSGLDAGARSSNQILSASAMNTRQNRGSQAEPPAPGEQEETWEESINLDKSTSGVNITNAGESLLDSIQFVDDPPIVDSSQDADSSHFVDGSQTLDSSQLEVPQLKTPHIENSQTVSITNEASNDVTNDTKQDETGDLSADHYNEDLTSENNRQDVEEGNAEAGSGEDDNAQLFFANLIGRNPFGSREEYVDATGEHDYDDNALFDDRASNENDVYPSGNEEEVSDNEFVADNGSFDG